MTTQLTIIVGCLFFKELVNNLICGTKYITEKQTVNIME